MSLSTNPDIVKRRKDLELLQEQERRLLERLTISDAKQRESKTINKQPNNKKRNEINTFEDFYYRERAKYENKRNAIQTTPQLSNSDDDYNGTPRKRPHKERQYQQDVELIELEDDEDDELKRVFENDGDHNDVLATELDDIEEETTERMRRAEIDSVQLLSSSFNETYNDEEDYEMYKSENEDRRPDQQHMVHIDIAEGLRRERELQYERGSIENLNDIDYESEEEESQIVEREDVREKIMRDIKESNLREMEIHTKYNNNGRLYNNMYDSDEDYDEDEKEGKEVIEMIKKDLRDKIAQEIQDLRKREQELRFHQGSYTASESGDSAGNDYGMEYMDTKQQIEREIRLQQEREVEINHIHRTLSNENLLTIKTYSGVEENEEDNNAEHMDTRSKILREIEEINHREKELRHSYALIDYDIISGKEGATNKEQSEVDIRDKIYKEMEELERREIELRKSHARRFDRTQSFDATQSFEELTIEDEAEPKEIYVARGLQDNDRKKFGSREDLVAFFGTSNSPDEESQNETKPKLVNIPRVFVENEQKKRSTNPFRKLSITDYTIVEQYDHPAFNIFANYHTQEPPFGQNNNQKPSQQDSDSVNDSSIPQSNSSFDGSHGSHLHSNSSHDGSLDNITYNGDLNYDHTDSYFKDEMKRMKTSKKKTVLRRRSLQNSFTVLPTKGFASQDVKKENKQKRQKPVHSTTRLNIHPIAAKWEQKGQEEGRRKLKLEMELQRRKEERTRYLTEKAEHERHLRLLEEEKEREKKQREEEWKLLRIKQKGLNELWISKKPIITDPDNPDRLDQHLLKYKQTPPREEVVKTTRITPDNSTTSHTTPAVRALAISKKIQKWEKKIAKNTQQH